MIRSASTSPKAATNDIAPATGSVPEVFVAFLKLGLTSFGGPIAHLGYFWDEFVRRRRWIDEARYGDLVALCQSLPGPALSQVAFALLDPGSAPFLKPGPEALDLFAVVVDQPGQATGASWR